jgi:hypothetical protein
MAYCTIAQVRARIGAPAAAPSDGPARDADGNLIDPRFSDATIQGAIDSVAAEMDAIVADWTTIPADSAVAQEINITGAAAMLLAGYKDEAVAGGGRWRQLDKTWQRYIKRMEDYPGMFGADVADPPIAVGDADTLRDDDE